jgi:branched-chain amino acid transport system permease protein
MKAITANFSPGYIITAIAIILLAVLPVAGMPRAWILYVLLFLIYLAMANMWNLIAGYAGLISLAAPAFMGIAGYILALGTWFGYPWWAGLIAGTILAGFFAFLMSFAVFRLSGIYFSIGTLVVPEILRQVFFLWRPVNVALVGGGAGYTVKGVAGLSMGQIYWMALAVAILSAIIIRIVLRSNLGLGLAAVRDNQRAAASSGVNTFRIKLYPFVIAALLTGLAGGIFFVYQQYIEPGSTFNVKWTMIILLATVIGGLRTEGGPIIGSVIVVFLYFSLSRYGNYSLLIQGVVLIAIMLLSPQGLVGIAKKSLWFNRLMGWLGRPLFSLKKS